MKGMRLAFSFPFVMAGISLTFLGMWIGGEKAKQIIFDSFKEALIESSGL